MLLSNLSMHSIVAMGNKRLLCLFLCLVLASFSEVSCQYEGVGDEGARGSSMLDLIEHEYQADISGRNLDGLNKEETEDQSAKKQSETQPGGQKNTTSDKSTISLSLLDESEGSLDNTHANPLDAKSTQNEVADESGEGSLDLDAQFQLDYQARINGLKQAESDGVNKDKDDKGQASKKSMLDEIELEYQANINGLKRPKIDEFDEVSKEDEQSAKRRSMLEDIEREYEAAAKDRKQLPLIDLSQGTGDEEQAAKRQSMLEEIEREYQAAAVSVNEEIKVDFSDGKNDEELNARRQSMLEEIEREYEAAARDVKQLNTDFAENKGDEEQSAKRQSMLEEIEREYEAAASDLKQLKVNFEDKDSEEQSKTRQSMLEEIEREYKANTGNIEPIKVDLTQDTIDEEQSEKRKSMLEEIEREFEASARGLNQPNIDEEQSEKRKRMLEEIEREFEAAASSLGQPIKGNDDEELSARRKSMLEEIEREYKDAAAANIRPKIDDFTEEKDDEQSEYRRSMLEEIEREYEAAASNIKQTKFDFTGGNDDDEQQAERRRNMLEEIEREFQDAVKVPKEDSKRSASKQSGSSSLGFLELGNSANVCGCFNQMEGSLKEDKEASVVIPNMLQLDQFLDDDISAQSSKTASLTSSLTQLVENHKNPKIAPSRKVSSFESSSSSDRSESLTKSENTERLKAKIKNLGGVSFHDLVARSDFDEILSTVNRFDDLDSELVSYISRLAKYKIVIKQGMEASLRAHMAQGRAKLLKEIADEKQSRVDSDIAEAKALAQRGDALYVKIVALKKLLAKLEGEKGSVDSKFDEIITRLSYLLEEASDAEQEYKTAFRKAKDEEAAQEFAREAAESAERIWVKFLSFL